jgi:hypothetical protein
MFVAVPKTAVNEDDFPQGSEDKVGAAGQRLFVQSVAESLFCN